MNDNIVAMIAGQIHDGAASVGEWSIPGNTQKLHYLFYLVNPSDSMTQ